MENQEEIWKPTLDGYYSISNKGNIKSEDRLIPEHGFHLNCLKKGTLLKHYNNGKGYRYVTISINSIRRNYYIHRLVAKAFIPNPNNKKTVNHKDGDKSNNNVSNLEWNSYIENCNHAVKIGLRKTGSLAPTNKKIIDIQNNIIYDWVNYVPLPSNVTLKMFKDQISRNKNRNNRPYLGRFYYLDFYNKLSSEELIELGLRLKE